MVSFQFAGHLYPFHAKFLVLLLGTQWEEILYFSEGFAFTNNALLGTLYFNI